jgi:hypothetical protein
MPPVKTALNPKGEGGNLPSTTRLPDQLLSVSTVYFIDLIEINKKVKKATFLDHSFGLQGASKCQK